MSDSGRPTWLRAAHEVARASLWPMLIGPSILLVYAWVEVLNNPGISLVDGYWTGRAPWVPLGIVTALVGAVAGLLAGALAIGVEGGWWRRFLVVPAAIGAGLWWSTALGLLPFPRFHGPDPVTFAYNLPAATAILVLVPAALLATIAITARRVPPPPVGLRPVAPVSGTALIPRRRVEPGDEDLG